jgi:hypothetical protein
MVKTRGESMAPTANLLIKIEIPETIAVIKAK